MTSETGRANLSDTCRAHELELINQLDFMRDKLTESRKQLSNAPIIIAYDNGGGQRGIRKNPAYDAYSQLMRTYLKALDELREISDGRATKQPQLVKFQKFADSMKKAADEG